MDGVEELVSATQFGKSVHGPLDKLARSIRGPKRLIVGLDGKQAKANAVVKKSVKCTEAGFVYADGEVLESDRRLANHLKPGIGHHVREATVVGCKTGRIALRLENHRQQGLLGHEPICGWQVVTNSVSRGPRARHGGGPCRIGP